MVVPVAVLETLVEELVVLVAVEERESLGELEAVRVIRDDAVAVALGDELTVSR